MNLNMEYLRYNLLFLAVIYFSVFFDALNCCLIFNPCRNGGQCYLVGTQSRCNCVDGWSGDRCTVAPASANVLATDMRPALLNLVQGIIVSQIVMEPDIIESAKQIRMELNRQWPCCWDVIVVDSSVQLGYAIWYVNDHHLYLNVNANAGHSRKVLVSKDNYDFATVIYDPNDDNYNAILTNPSL